MAKIHLEIEDKNLSTVLNILNNLKAGLIKNIIEDKQNLESQTKYISKSKYKQKLIKENTSSSKYLSSNDFKNKLKVNKCK